LSVSKTANWNPNDIITSQYTVAAKTPKVVKETSAKNAAKG
jgi:hypothetical protein